MNQTTFPKTFPTFETERLILRNISQADTAAIFHNFSDPDIAIWFFEQPHTEIEQTVQIINQFISEFEQGKGLTWAIALRENNQCVGTCGYGEIETSERGEIGFDLAKDYWGKGLMGEALKPIIDYGFSVLKLVKVEAHTYSINLRARHLLEKVGFQLEKVSEDSHHYFISKMDWSKSGSRP